MESFIFKKTREIFFAVACATTFILISTLIIGTTTIAIAETSATDFTNTLHSMRISQVWQSASWQSCIVSAEMNMTEKNTAHTNAKAATVEMMRCNFRFFMLALKLSQKIFGVN